MPRAVVITGPSGVGKGTLIRSLRERMPDLQLSISATTRLPRAGETQDVDYHFMSPEDFERHVAAGDFVEHADYAGARYGTLRSELQTRASSGAPVVLEIEVQGARQVRASMPEAVQVFIAPPSIEALRARLVGPRHRRARADRGASADRRGGARRAARVRPCRRQRPPRGRRRRAGRDRAAASRRCAVARGPWLPWRMISPRIDRLLENVDSNYASVVVAAKRARQINSYYHNLGEGTFDEFPPPMVDTGSKNYLTIALEEVAAGKIKYQYR